MEHVHDDVPHRQLVAFVDAYRLRARCRQMPHIVSADGLCQPATARDVIGMHVRVDHVSDVHARLGCRADVCVNIVEGIDDGARGVTAASKQIRRRNGFGVQELAEDHARTPDRFAPMTAKARAVFSFDVPRKQS
jgi:hypothetical protein